MRARSIVLAELDEGDLGRWRELAARAAEPNPFFEPQYVLPLARALGHLDAARLLAVADSGGGWRACMPVHGGRWHRLPLPSVSSWHGDPFYGLLGTPLIDAEHPVEALAELLSAMLDGGGAWFAAIDLLSADGSLAPAIAEVFGGLRPAPLCFEQFERAAVRRRPEPTYLQEALSAKRRKELRRQRRRLGEALGGEPEIVERAGEDRAYDEFIALEAAGKKRTRGTVLAADPRHSAFFREICREFAELGRLQLPSLTVAGQTVATQCNLVAGDTIFGIKIAYDERWAEFSPGIQLEVEMVEVFHKRTSARTLDSCADPTNPTMNRLWPDRRRLAAYVLRRPGIAGAAAGSVVRAARGARDFRRQRRLAQARDRERRP